MNSRSGAASTRSRCLRRGRKLRTALLSATPLQPILEFLRSSYFLIAPDDDPRSAVKAIDRRLAEIGPSFEADLPLVCDFLGVPYTESPPIRLNPRARNTRILEIVRQLVRHRGDMPSVILIEDLHWLDPASEAFVVDLGRGRRDDRHDPGRELSSGLFRLVDAGPSISADRPGRT